MPNKAKTSRRLADQWRVVSMMPIGKPISCMELVAKIGDLSFNSIGAFLRNAYKNGLVEKAGTKCVLVRSNYQIVTLWIRLNTAKKPPAVQWVDAQDQQWIDYWQARRKQRQMKINQEKHHAHVSATLI